MQTRLAVVLVVVTGTSMAPGSAAANGERTPMFGGAVTFSDAGDRGAELVGAELELAWWSGRLGLAVEGGARRAIVEDDDARNLSLAGSARVLVADWLWPSLFEPRDVECGIELQAIAERTWWGRDDSTDAFGFGAAIRMRGGSDWEFSALLAESRLFVRVMKSQEDTSDVIARTAAPMAGAGLDRGGVTVLVGLGAAFGAGTPRYLERFRLKPREWAR